MKFGLEELLVKFIRINLGFDGSVCMDEKLLFEPHSEVKSYIIRISFNSKSKKVNLEFDFKLNQVLESQPELSAHDEDLDSLGSIEELRMRLQEFSNVIMREKNVTVSELSFTLVRYQNRNEINELDDCLLVEINLSIFDFDQFITNVFIDMQHDFILQHVLDHLVIFGHQELQNIISGYVKERIIRNGDLQLRVFCQFGDEPS